MEKIWKEATVACYSGTIPEFSGQVLENGSNQSLMSGNGPGLVTETYGKKYREY
jgi:hypothetical protein